MRVFSSTTLLFKENLTYAQYVLCEVLKRFFLEIKTKEKNLIELQAHKGHINFIVQSSPDEFDAVAKAEIFRIPDFMITEKFHTMNYAMTYPIFHSKAQMDLVIKTMRDNVSDARIKDTIDNSAILTFGINCDEIDEMIEGIEKIDAVHWSHKLYNMPLKVRAFDVMNLLYIMHSWKPMITSGSVNDMKIPKEYKAGQFDIVLGAKREDFIKRAATAKICISNNKYEDFSATVAEQIYAGCVPLLHKSAFAEYVTPPDYPWLFETDEQLKKAVIYLADHPEELDKWRPICKQYIRDNFNGRDVNARLYDHVGDKYKKHLESVGMPKGVVDLIRDVMEAMRNKGYTECTIDDLYRNMEEMSRNGKDYHKFAGQHGMSRLMMYQMAKKVADDDYTKDIPTFLLHTIRKNG